jgi:hypothetical protein
MSRSQSRRRGTGDRALAAAAFPVGRSHNGTHAAAIGALAVFGYDALAAAPGVSLANGYGGGRSCGGPNPPAPHLVNKPGARKVSATSSAAWRLARLPALVAQEREHGRDAPVHLLLASQVQLGEDCVDVLLD